MLGETESTNLTDDENLSVIPIEEIVTEDGKPGQREGLFYMRDYLMSLGIPGDVIICVDTFGDHPGIHRRTAVPNGSRL